MADNGQQWVKTKNNSKQWAIKATIMATMTTLTGDASINCYLAGA